MEVKRENAGRFSDHRGKRGFNPCFDGSEARETHPVPNSRLTRCFNPCFDGSEARVGFGGRECAGQGVSILVLMEVKREDILIKSGPSSYMFQSLF